MYLNQVGNRTFVLNANRCMGDVTHLFGIWVAYHYILHYCSEHISRSEALKAISEMDRYSPILM